MRGGKARESGCGVDRREVSGEKVLVTTGCGRNKIGGEKSTETSRECKRVLRCLSALRRTETKAISSPTD